MSNMKEKFIGLFKHQLINASFYSAIATLIKLLTAFVSAKYISKELGAEGLGVIGQLNSFVLIVTGFSAGLIGNAVVKLVAENVNNEQQQQRVLEHAIKITLLGSLLLSLVVIVGAGYWSEKIFHTLNYKWLIQLFGVTLICYALFNLTVSILNGKKAFKQLNLLNIVSSVVGLIFTLIMIYYFKLTGALLAIVTYQIVVFLIAVFYLKNELLHQQGIRLFSYFDLPTVRLFLQFALMSIITMIALPYVQILIRNHLTITFNAEVTGFYEAISRISTIYLTVITTTLSVYYLPRLSELHQNSLIRHEIKTGYKLIVPMMLFMIVGIYLFRKLLIQIAFTEQFLPMESYFLPQLIGDFFKICSWLLAFLMLAKAMTKVFIATEIIFSVSLYGFTLFFTSRFGPIGAIYAYAFNYVLYMLAMIVIFKKLLFTNE